MIAARLFLQRRDGAAAVHVRPLWWLAGLGSVSALVYALVLVHGNFRPRRMEPFFLIFGVTFALYVMAVWLVVRRQRHEEKSTADSNPRLLTIFAVAVLFNVILLFSWPSLSDDMFRYIWDGRVQAAGVNPYRYASNAPELIHLRDDRIWKQLNRKDAVTIYPPFAQMVFAAAWRVFPDSVKGMKLVMIAATLLAGWLLVRLLRAFNQPPERVLIFLWSPLLIFEVAHAAHVDALYLPLVVGAFLLRARAPANRAPWRWEAGIGILLGLAALVKLYPIILAVPLWSLRDSDGRRRWRLALPLALLVTIAAGYALYNQPGVNTLGFLPKYGKEFFNVSPLMRLVINWAAARGIPWYQVANVGMPLLLGLVSLWFIIRPAHQARGAILRCFWPIGIYLLVNHNLFSWYALWLLPLVALDLRLSSWRSLFALNGAFAWWAFSGAVALSYTFFLRWQIVPVAMWLQFTPVYILLGAVCCGSIYTHFRTRLQQP